MQSLKELILLELQITQTRQPLSILDKKRLSSTPVINEKKLLNMHKIDGAHLQCVNNNYAKFEYNGMNTFGVTDYTN